MGRLPSAGSLIRRRRRSSCHPEAVPAPPYRRILSATRRGVERIRVSDSSPASSEGSAASAITWRTPSASLSTPAAASETINAIAAAALSNAAHDLGEQIVLAPHVVIEGADGDAGFGGDIANAGPLVALLDDEPQGRLANAVMGRCHSGLLPLLPIQ